MKAADGLEWMQIYWIRGTLPAKSRAAPPAVKDPPCTGWQHAFIIRYENKKRLTLFCPYTLQGYQVPPGCSEVVHAAEPDGEAFRREWAVALIRRKWGEFQHHGFARDYDTAAVVLDMLGAAVPENVERPGKERRSSGGKAAESSLKKPVKRESMRGKVLAWFLEEGGTAKPLRQAMVDFEKDRNNLLSHLFMLWKDHGIGYTLTNDMVTITLPTGCTDPFSG